jgi:hypothetical protein
MENVDGVVERPSPCCKIIVGGPYSTISIAIYIGCLILRVRVLITKSGHAGRMVEGGKREGKWQC